MGESFAVGIDEERLSEEPELVEGDEMNVDTEGPDDAKSVGRKTLGVETVVIVSLLLKDVSVDGGRASSVVTAIVSFVGPTVCATRSTSCWSDDACRDEAGFGVGAAGAHGVVVGSLLASPSQGQVVPLTLKSSCSGN